MQYDENAEKYGYEGEMTPLKCDELKAYKGDVTIPVYGSIADAQVYLKKDVDEAIAELKEAWRSEHEACKALKAKIENVQASAYAEIVDAGMRERRLKRALYKACANWAHHRVFVRFKTNEKAWENVEHKCLKKADEYK